MQSHLPHVALAVLRRRTGSAVSIVPVRVHETVAAAWVLAVFAIIDRAGRVAVIYVNAMSYFMADSGR